MSAEQILSQVLQSFIFYLGVVLIFRIAGKRLAGQTSTFDLLVLITISVNLSQATLDEGKGPAFVFVVTVFLLHLLFVKVCLYSPKLRYILRGAPTKVISDGEVLYRALAHEGLTFEELKAGLRKLGIERLEDVKQAQLEETGQVSAITRQ